MLFSNFIRTASTSQITFKNSIAIENVKNIKFFKDDSSGSFSKKEFRWSFDNNYWSSWSVLNQGNVVSINTTGKLYLFLEIRYTGLGSVSVFSITYDTNPYMNITHVT